MSHRMAALALFVGITLTASTAWAIVPFSFGAEKIILVKDLPNAFTKNFDIGWKYKQVTIFFMPVWNYEGEFTGYVGRDNKYLPINDMAKLKAAMKKFKIEFPAKPKLSMWERVGGKVAVGGVFALFAFAGFMRKRR